MFECILHEEGLERAVTAMVRSGFYEQDYIADFFTEIAIDDPDSGLDSKTISEDVRRIFNGAQAKLLKDVAEWPVKTDNDKLTAAFQQLNKTGIRAAENYGYEAGDCGELYGEIKGDSQWRGYCFYHNQDLVRVMQSGQLAIRYSAALVNPTDNDNKNVAKTIVNVLGEHGLHPKWDGDPRKIILLSINWERRPTGNQVVNSDVSDRINSNPWWKLW